MRYLLKCTRKCMWMIAFLSICTSSAFALIEGGEGNTPINDPGWPKGAAEIFNHKGRIKARDRLCILSREDHERGTDLRSLECSA